MLVSGWPQTRCIADDDTELLIFLPHHSSAEIMGMSHPPQFINIYLKKIARSLSVSMSNKDTVVRRLY